MDETSREPLPLAAHGDAVAPVPDRDRGVGDAHPFGQGGREPLESRHQTRSGTRQRPPDPAQLGRCAIGDSARVVERGGDSLLERPVSPQSTNLAGREAVGLESVRDRSRAAARRHDPPAGA